MKKIYIIPQIEIDPLEEDCLLAASGPDEVLGNAQWELDDENESDTQHKKGNIGVAGNDFWIE